MKTRKLKDLKENECIKVNTLKEAKYFVDLIGWPITPSELVDAFIFPKNGVLTNYSNLWDIRNYQGKKELPASDFIKPKKPKKWKEAFQEIARLDGENEAMRQDIERLDKELIKLKLSNSNISVTMPNYGTKEFVSMLDSSTKPHSTDCRNLHVKDAEDVNNQYIDWSFPGQAIDISYGFYSSLIVTSGKHEGDCFEGLCIRSTKDSQVGTFGSEWSKNFTKVILKKY